MTNYVDELHDRMKRVQEVQKIKGRLKKLAKKIRPGTNRKWSTLAFCEEYGIDNTQLAHAMGGRRGLEWGTIETINQALDKLLPRKKVAAK